MLGEQGTATGVYILVSFFFFFFCQRALDATAAVAQLGKHWLRMRIWTQVLSNQIKKPGLLFLGHACPPRAGRQRPKDLSGAPWPVTQVHRESFKDLPVLIADPASKKTTNGSEKQRRRLCAMEEILSKGSPTRTCIAWQGHSYVMHPNASDPWEQQGLPGWGWEQRQSLPLSKHAHDCAENDHQSFFPLNVYGLNIASLQRLFPPRVHKPLPLFNCV